MWRVDRSWDVDILGISVDASTVDTVVFDIVTNIVSIIALVDEGILCDIVCKIDISTEDLAVVSLPVDHVAEHTIYKETIRSNVIGIYFETSVCVVCLICNLALSILGVTPEPRIVHDNVRSVDLHHVLDGGRAF